jgi:catalase
MPSPDLSPVSKALRLVVVVGVIAGIAVLFAWTGGWFTPHALTPVRIVDRFETLNGVHPGFRRNHAKGLCFTGWFDSDGQGTAFSKALVFNSGRIPVVGRFSLSGGNPYATDANVPVRGLAVLFKLPDGEEWRTAMINLPVFPVSTPQAFYDQLIAFAPASPSGKPDPAKVQAFLASYPESAKAIKIIHGNPLSSGFENSTFNSLNAFRFTDTNGTVAWGR